MREHWKRVPDSYLEISDQGRLRYERDNGTSGRSHRRAGDVVRLQLSRLGVPFVILVNAVGKRTAYFPARLVAQFWLGPCRPGEEVAHRDGNKRNNCVANLVYLTHKANLQHISALGLIPNSKLTQRDVDSIRELAASGCLRRLIAARYKISVATVRRVLREVHRKWPVRIPGKSIDVEERP